MILVTGAKGFIGTRLCKEFQDVKGIDMPEHDITKSDSLLGLKGFECVVHLAAVSNAAFSISNPALTFKVNVDGTENVLEMMRQNDIPKIVFPSTAHVYGKVQYNPVDEGHPLNPNSPYAESKVKCEELIREYAAEHGIKFTVLRLFNVFAPNGNKEMVIPSVISQVKAGNDVIVKDLYAKRDFIYITDVIDAMKKAVFFKGDGIFNIASGESHSIQEVIEKVIEVSGKNLSFKGLSESRFNEANEMYADISKAKSELGWGPKVSFFDGLSMAYENTDG